ncbi:hypothetical protein WN55_06056 [Dufourea novaeangliae]|uniref:Uncharacterized protein n=1 Tax=Dufourea novaeangliae TaxID=178035 RepID=A0A154PPS8_DUFNO|nr:hypothetical protein WN55_06056 [Dufourea novaeangliae]
MAALFMEQETLRRSINRIVANLEKKGVNNYNKAMVSVRLDYLDTFWSTFLKNHLELQNIFTVTERRKHDYFRQYWYDQTVRSYLNQRVTLCHILEGLTVETSKVTTTATPEVTASPVRPTVQPISL